MMRVLTRRSRRWFRAPAAAGALVALLAAARVGGMAPTASPSNSARSQPTSREDKSERPESARRFVRLFDFEDPGNPDPVPAGWLRAQEDQAQAVGPGASTGEAGRDASGERRARPGFPSHNEAAYDFKTAHSGKASIRVPVHGGSASLRLQAGELPIFADADYAVTASVKTRGVVNARAFLTARVLDSTLKPIAGSQTRSVGLSDANASEWTTAALELPARYAAAAWLQIDLELIQPRLWREPGVIGDHEVWEEDLSGEAWFDDVLVFLQPRAALRSVQKYNVAGGGEAPELEASVRDLGGDALTAIVRVMDLRGRPVDSTTFGVDPSGLPQRWKPRLPGFGYYTASLEVISNTGLDRAGKTETGVRVARASVPIGWTAAETGTSIAPAGSGARFQADLRRFGVVGSQRDADDLERTAGAIGRLGTRFVLLPMFGPGVLRADAKEQLSRRAAGIEALLGEGQTITWMLESTPTELARSASLDPGDPLAMVTRPTSEWFSYLQPMLDRFGQQVLRYQVGEPGSERLMWRDRLSEDLSAFEEQVSTLVPGPRIAVAWRADQARPMIQRRLSGEQPDGTGEGGAVARQKTAARKQGGALVDDVTLLFPAGFGAEQVASVLDEWTAPDSRGERPEITLVLELPDPERFSARDTVRALARRLVSVWSTLGVEDESEARLRVAISAPWTRFGSRGDEIGPRPEWPAFTQLARALSGRRVVGEYPSDPGVRCLILAQVDPRSGELSRGALVAWQTGLKDGALSASTVARRNRSAAGGGAAVGTTLDPTPLGESIQIVDVFGNRRELTDAERVAGLELSDMPVFIEGIDPYVAEFVSGMKLDPRFVESVVSEHESQVLLENPWPIRVTGSLQVREADAEFKRATRSDAWNITPAGIVDFAIGPGETYRLPISFTFGPSQLAGYKKLQILARVTADRDYPLLKLNTTMEVGLRDFQMDLEAQRLPINGGPDLVVIASVTNTSTRTRSLRLEAATARLPTQQLQISDLGSGQTIVKRFVFKGAGPALSGKTVLVALSDLEEAKRLNKGVIAP
jgi:hypothetical protein